MCIEIVLHQPDFDGLRKCACQSLTKQRVFLFSSLGMHLCQAKTGQRFNGCQQRTRTMFFVSIVFFAHLPRLHDSRRNVITNQKARTFIKADQRVLWIVCQSVEIQKLLHACQKTAIQLAKTPGPFQVRFQFVFLRISFTSVCEMCSQYASSTALSAKSRKLQRAYPSGGSLQAKAVILAR